MNISPIIRRREAVILGTVLLAATLADCASSDKSSKTTPIRFVIEADQQVNPNENGQPSPVVVRIYELKSTTAFDQAQFFELLDNDVKLLGPDLVAKREVELKPGDKTDFKRDTPIDTHYVGIMAAFRSADSAQWRKTAEITAERDNSVLVKVTAQAISIEKEASKDWWSIF